MKAYLHARALAISQGDQETLAAIYFNLSSVYFQMGEEDATSASAERGLELPLTASAKYRSKLLIQSALIKVRAKNYREAVPQLRQAVDVARAQLDTATEAQAWNELGNTLLECDQQPAAENALLESYRLRKLNRDRRLHFSYESLAELRLAQDHPAAALPFLDRALDSAEALGPGACGVRSLRGERSSWPSRKREPPTMICKQRCVTSETGARCCRRIRSASAPKSNCTGCIPPSSKRQAGVPRNRAKAVRRSVFRGRRRRPCGQSENAVEGVGIAAATARGILADRRAVAAGRFGTDSARFRRRQRWGVAEGWPRCRQPRGWIKSRRRKTIFRPGRRVATSHSFRSPRR